MVMEVLERSLKVERGLCLRMNEEEEKNCGYRQQEVGHGRATLGTDRANLLDTGASKIFNFLESYSDNYLQNT
jgi:hypothetical protein